jgi:hypothetical protein
MKKKSRFFAAAGLVVLAAALLFTGCQNPAGGPPGGTGSPPGAPAFSISGLSASTITLTADTSGVSYDVYYNQDGTPPTAETAATATATGTTVTVSGLTDYTPYYIWVRARNDAGTSAYSGPVVAASGAVNLEYLKGYHQTDIVYSNWGTYGGNNNEWQFTDDGFVIDQALKTFTYYDTATGTIGYAGTIEGIVAEDAVKGRIILKITDGGTQSMTSGSYIAVAYKDLSASQMDQAIATKSAGQNSGVPTLKGAVDEYAYDEGAGYFGFFGTYKPKTVTPEALAALKGKWYDYDDDLYTVIRGNNTFLQFMDGDDTAYDEKYAPDADDYDMLAAAGEVVEYTDPGAASGILYVRNVVAGDVYAANQYVAVGWKNRNGNNIDFAIGNDAKSSLAEIKTTYANASAIPGAAFKSYVKQ